jgi:uncharacterized protein (DUF39 family)
MKIDEFVKVLKENGGNPVVVNLYEMIAEIARLGDKNFAEIDKVTVKNFENMLVAINKLEARVTALENKSKLLYWSIDEVNVLRDKVKAWVQEERDFDTVSWFQEALDELSSMVEH